MPAGFQVFNDYNVIQIDADYRNYHLVRAGQFNTGSGDFANINMAGLTQNAIWALIPQSYPGMSPHTGGFWNGQKWFQYWFANTISAVNVQYYIFDLVNPIGGTRSGLEVYDAAGRLVFDSSGMSMRVAGTFWSASGGNDNVINIPSGKNYALTPLQGGRWEQDDGVGGDFEARSSYFYKEGQKFKFWQYYVTDPIGGGPDSPYDWGMTEMYGLIVDVTGMPANYSR